MWRVVARVLDVCGLLHEFREALKTLAGLKRLRNYELHTVTRKEPHGRNCGWAPLTGNWLATNFQLEAEARIRKLKKELKLEKDIRVPTTLLASGRADGVEEQNRFSL